MKTSLRAYLDANLQTVLFASKALKIKKINKQRQHDYKPNRNVTAGLLKRFLVKIMLRPVKERRHWLKDLFRQILQQMEPVRPEKNNPDSYRETTTFDAWH